MPAVGLFIFAPLCLIVFIGLMLRCAGNYLVSLDDAAMPKLLSRLMEWQKEPLKEKARQCGLWPFFPS